MTMTVTVTMMTTTTTMMIMMMMIGDVKKRNYRYFSSAEIFRKPFSVRGKRSSRWSNMLKVFKSFSKKKKMSCLLACEQALPGEPYVIA